MPNIMTRMVEGSNKYFKNLITQLRKLIGTYQLAHTCLESVRDVSRKYNELTMKEREL